MFVITADQVNSRGTSDQVAATLDELNRAGGLTLAAERTAGDELQLVTADAGTALRVLLELSRSEQWSTGCGIGPVDLPLPRSTREASGDAFIAARTAIDRAKKRATRTAIVSVGSDVAPSASDLQAVLDLLLHLRERRSAEGWELYDLVRHGRSQADAAARLGITPQAASKRAQAAHLRAEAEATVALARLMEAHDASASAAASADTDKG
ncbi:DNA-binding protein [Salinibacterium sp. ZJ450]|uniref:DNA-binding protein n=1 Tax=Salinibacterium sp. ZJ450 TaxID=2708338 RepID=UPI00142441F3|nr:DNA-binding protein [Salinibacterium sp. ZJ450]